MIDTYEIKGRCSSTTVYFKGLPEGHRYQTIYIENAYHKRFNRFLKLCSFGLWKLLYEKYECGFSELVYIPAQSNKIGRKLIKYRYPFLSSGEPRRIPKIKTTDLLDYLEDPSDTHFLRPGFLFFRGMKENGISAYEYYPIIDVDDSWLLYFRRVREILETQKENADKYQEDEGSRIGESGALYKKQSVHDEDYADLNEDQFDLDTQHQLSLFKKQAYKLQELGVPMVILENILHQNDRYSKLVITKEYEILLPDYNNMIIKMEPIVKAVFILFLRHPEGLMFKELPDYREELTEIYLKLKPNGLTERAKKSIEDVTDPTLNSINEKCARIRSAFIDKFDEHLAKHYFITGGRAEPKKIALPRKLVVWET